MALMFGTLIMLCTKIPCHFPWCTAQAADSGKLLGAGRKRHPHCRLHLKLTYLPVGEATMRRAEAADPAAPADAPGAAIARFV